MTDSSTSDSPETLAGTAAPLQAETGAGRSTSAAEVSRGRSPVWLLSLNIVLLGGLGFLGYALLQQRAGIEVLYGEVHAQEQRSATIEQQLAAAESARISLAGQLQAALAENRDSALQSDVLALQQELEALRRNVAAQTTPQRAWLLEEAAGLLRLAERQLLHATNVASAISLYQAADAVLRQAAEPALQPVRAALQLELDALRAVELPQIPNLYLQLGELRRQLDTLQVQSESEGPLRFVAPEAGGLPAAPGWWEQARQMLGEYFVVTRQDAPVLARLGPEQAFLIRQAVHLQLESARLALLQGDQGLYQTALNAALEGVTGQLQGDNKAAVLASLQRLRTERIEVQLPALGSALQALELLGDRP